MYNRNFDRMILDIATQSGCNTCQHLHAKINNLHHDLNHAARIAARYPDSLRWQTEVHSVKNALQVQRELADEHIKSTEHVS